MTIGVAVPSLEQPETTIAKPVTSHARIDKNRFGIIRHNCTEVQFPQVNTLLRSSHRSPSSLLLLCRPPNVRIPVSILASVAALALTSCIRTPAAPPLCGEGAACAEGKTCVVGRCRLSGNTLLGPTDGHRLVLAPDGVAVTSSRDLAGGSTQVPAVVVLGRGASSLFLHFAVPISDAREVTAAVLILEPPRDALPPASPLPLQIAPILDPWTPDNVSNGRLPSLGVPEHAGVFAGSFGGIVRIDVTSFVKRWAERDEDDHGLVISADDTDAYGSSFSLGITEGRGPRLEVYLR
jgi:hypothetical protein